jgi:hypothetical protein
MKERMGLTFKSSGDGLRVAVMILALDCLYQRMMLHGEELEENERRGLC